MCERATCVDVHAAPWPCFLQAFFLGHALVLAAGTDYDSCDCRVPTTVVTATLSPGVDTSGLASTWPVLTNQQVSRHHCIVNLYTYMLYIYNFSPFCLEEGGAPPLIQVNGPCMGILSFMFGRSYGLNAVAHLPQLRNMQIIYKLAETTAASCSMHLHDLWDVLASSLLPAGPHR